MIHIIPNVVFEFIRLPRCIRKIAGSNRGP